MARFFYVSEDDGFSIERLNLETGAVSRVAEIESFAEDSGAFAVSPDGSWFLVTQQDEAETDLMLVEGFE